MERMIRMRAKEILGKLQLHGRTFYDEEKQALFFNWTCSGFTAVFSGSVLKARFTAMGDKGPAFPGFPEPAPDYPCFGVIPDGGELSGRAEVREEEGEYTLFQGEAGTHTLRVVKLSENARGKLGLLALETDGEFLAAPKNDKPVIEVVGDSITCGFGNEAENGSFEFRTGEENGWMSYAALAARELGCEWSLVCESGICAGQPEKAFIPHYAMDDIYAYTDAPYAYRQGREPEAWDFAGHPSDIVVIDLGTNDATPMRFSPDPFVIDGMEEHFQKKFRGLVEQIRRLNGKETLIVCSLGSMDYFLYDRIEAAVREYRADTGDERIFAFKYLPINNMSEGVGAAGHPSMKTHLKMSEGVGAAGHPSMKTHLRMGRELAFRLRPYLKK